MPILTAKQEFNLIMAKQHADETKADIERLLPLLEEGMVLGGELRGCLTHINTLSIKLDTLCEAYLSSKKEE